MAAGIFILLFPGGPGTTGASCLLFPPAFAITGDLSRQFLNASSTGSVPEQEPWCLLFPKLLKPVVSQL